MPAASAYAFGPFRLDPQTRRLTRDGEHVTLPDRHLEVLIQLASHPGTILSKDALVAAAWGDVAVTDNSLEQAVSSLRRTLGAAAETPYIETVPRRGYRFAAAVTRVAARESDAGLDGMLAPHRAWLEGRAALQTLERQQIERARAVFGEALVGAPEQPLVHIGLANACVLLFETTRTDRQPDVASLQAAAGHAREACRLDPHSGEAWATLGFVLDRTGRQLDAVAALRRAATLEADNWRHHFRLSYVSWGEERLRAARRTLALLPGFPLAHWMIATVLVARGLLDQAEHELALGIASEAHRGEAAPFSAVGLEWLRGLILLARGAEDEAAAAFERELAGEPAGHLYARECCANTWYAIGTMRLRRRQESAAREAFLQALTRVPAHPHARVALTAAGHQNADSEIASTLEARLGTVDAAVAYAVDRVLHGDPAGGARAVDEALGSAPPGNAGWLLPVEPLLRVWEAPDLWAPALDRLRARSA